MPTPVKLIIHADDLGLSEGVNQGIFELWDMGAITSTSLLVGMPSTSHAVHELLMRPEICVGLHVSLTQGKRLSSPEKNVFKLVDRNGRFMGIRHFLLNYFIGNLPADEISREIKSQIETFIDLVGKTPTHLDSHMYLHAFPGIMNIFIETVKEYGIIPIRNPLETLTLKNSDETGYVRLRQALVSFLIRKPAKQSLKLLKNSGIPHPDNFWGIQQMNARNPNIAFRDIVESLRPGTNEIMCHPGESDSELVANTWFSTARKKELFVLKSASFTRLIAESSITLTSYDELSKQSAWNKTTT